MAQEPGNLNAPPEGQEAIDPKTRRLSSALTAWFASIARVTGDWVVGGALTAATATITGLLTAGSAIFTTAMTVPTNGKLYAGDTAWHVIGAAGEPAFQGTWANDATRGPCQFRRLSTGLVLLEGHPNRNASGTVAFTLPAGYRPANKLNFPTLPLTAAVPAVSPDVLIDTNGDVYPNSGGRPGTIWPVNLCFYAEA